MVVAKKGGILKGGEFNFYSTFLILNKSLNKNNYY